jgi:predicted transcriptional regulator YheO
MSGSWASRLKVENPTKKKNSNKVFLLDGLKILVDGIAKTFGSCCEVALHDLSNLDWTLHRGCNRIVLIGEGSVIAEMATEHFLRNPSQVTRE